MKDKRKVFGVIGLIVTVFIIVCAVAFKLYTDRYYREDTKVTQAIATEYQDVVSSYSDDNGMVFLPKDQDYKAVIVFYPGGKVEYTAYSGLLYELAAEGYICLLPRMPENLAFLQVNAVDGIRERHPEETAMVDSLDWYLAGHSLGGVAACTYVQEHSDDFSGVILCASYPST
ncbi:MAG: alpha/beta hydrolase, partial [Lachnospiraceae bacterium]|nr:alpha/beta hydrolase [Lachnospiraceae bacterium]